MSYSLRQQMSLEGRVAVITGSANILGPQFAAALAEFCAKLALVDVDGEGCDRVAREIRESYGTDAIAIVADVANEQAVSDMVRKVQSDFGRIDILVNAAATKSPHYFKPLAEYDLADWNEVMAVNLTGAFLCTKYVVPHFVSESRGNIINMIDIHGERPLANHSLYSTAKAGLAMLTRSLARELAPDVRVNGISPGVILWPKSDDPEDGERRERQLKRVPLGSEGDPQDIAEAVLFLAERAPYVTGQIIAVDGGRSLT